MTRQNLFHRLLGLDQIYARKYGLALILDPIYAGLFLWIAYILADGVLPEQAPLVHQFINLLIVIAVVYFVIETIKAAYVMLLVRRRHYSKIPSYIKNTRIFASAINEELDYIDRVELLEYGKSWGVYDVTFNFYRKTKRGRYLSKQAFYTVMEIKMPRIMPHLLFDSKFAKSDQFRKFYVPAQRLTMDVNFDDYFQTYAPKSYHIDTLSFITPEVLQAMIGLRDCDIEMIDDSIMCFAPLLTKPQVEQLKIRGVALADALHHNLRSYRDDRLSGARRVHDVTNFSRRLLESPRRFVLPAAFGGFVGLVMLVAAYRYQIKIGEYYYLVIIAWSAFVTNLGRIVTITRRNARLEKSLQLERQLEHAIHIGKK